MTNPDPSNSDDQFSRKLRQLRSDLVTQAGRVKEQLVRAVECAFDHDEEKARLVIETDRVIDKADVDIEKASVPLLAMGETEPYRIRSILTVVKINNELERIADCSVNIAEVVRDFSGEFGQCQPPPTFRVMANSVIGMVRDANRALNELNVELGRQVLQFDDTVDKFKSEIFLDAERQVAEGAFPVTFAFRLRTVTAQLERIADHATNMCEQVIYLESGKTVRHLSGGWTAPELPE